MAEARRIAGSFGGAEIENSIAKVIRAMPFPPLNSMLGPTGRLGSRSTASTSLSTAPAIFARSRRSSIAVGPRWMRHEIHTGYLFTTMATNAIIIEPVFFWPAGLAHRCTNPRSSRHTSRG